MHYVDGFVLPVPNDNIEAYRRLARKAGKVWMEYGALAYMECIGDDVPPGKSTSFAKSVKLKADETVVFSWIVYKSRAHRDRVNKLVMAVRASPAWTPNRCRSTASACSGAASRVWSNSEAPAQAKR